MGDNSEILNKLDEILEKIGSGVLSSTVYYLGTGTSFNVKDKTGLDDSILSDLTKDNFFIDAESLYVQYGWNMNTADGPKGNTGYPSITYNNETFTVNVSGLTVNSNNSQGATVAYGTIKTGVYLVVGVIISKS